jgi:alkylation response protein AidB-like acyl-CoA dehydrogenase
MSDHEELEAYRATMRAWLEANLPRREPSGALRDAREVTAEQVAVDRAMQRQVYEAGYLGITWPKEYGGQGLTSAHQQVWNQESRGFAVPMPGGIASGVTMGLVAPTLLTHASDEQKREWIPKILSGDELWVQLLSEPGAGSDLAGVLTRATKDGDSWVITGTKVWSSGATAADYGICLARTDWDAPKHRGLTWFKVPLHHPDVTVRPIREINGSAEFCEEFIEELVLGDDMRIGDLNDGWSIANTLLMHERSMGASADHAPTTAKERRQLAPDLVQLAEARGVMGDGHVRQLIAKVHIDDFMYEQLIGWLSIAMRTKAVSPVAGSYIKLARGVLEPLRVSAAMEIAGRRGVAWRDDDTTAHTTATNYLNGRIYSIAGGSNQIQRNIISERLLGLPREPGFDTDKSFRQVLDDAKNWGSKGPVVR